MIIKKYVQVCNQYQRIKDRVKILIEKLISNIVLERLQQPITVDFITKLPWLKNYDYINNIYTQFLKISHCIVMTEKTPVKELVRLFRNCKKNNL